MTTGWFQDTKDNNNWYYMNEDFGRWNKGSDGVLAGLTRRRACEARLFLTGNYLTDI